MNWIIKNIFICLFFVFVHNMFAQNQPLFVINKYSDSTIKSVGYLYQGNPIGYWKYYYNNGNLAEIGFYEIPVEIDTLTFNNPYLTDTMGVVIPKLEEKTIKVINEVGDTLLQKVEVGLNNYLRTWFFNGNIKSYFYKDTVNNYIIRNNYNENSELIKEEYFSSDFIVYKVIHYENDTTRIVYYNNKTE